MARNWPRLPAYDTRQDAEVATPIGWSALQIESLYSQLPIGKRFEQKGTNDYGIVPVIDQSANGVLGWHNEEPGIQATPDRPVITFANHTCEMRVMRRPFSVIQNVFPLIGRPGVCSSEFLYYATKGRVHLEEYKGHYPDFRRKWIPVPPDPEQRAIARILGALDDKIELNRKMNATLEAMARALFKSWFVDFDPVRAKAEGRAPSGMDAETAKLFPSEFVESELGPIPKGWEPGRIGDVIEIHDSRRVPLSSREREQRRGPFAYYGATSVMDYVDSYLFDGRFVLVGEDGSVVTPEGLPFTQYVWGRFWVNNHAHVLTGIRGFSQEHLYLLFQQTNIAAYVTGAVQAKLSQGNMRKIPVVVAPDAVNANFGSTLAPLFACLRTVTEESRTLTRLRNELLPRLLSGELSVDAVEREVEAVA